MQVLSFKKQFFAKNSSYFNTFYVEKILQRSYNIEMVNSNQSSLNNV